MKKQSGFAALPLIVLISAIGVGSSIAKPPMGKYDFGYYVNPETQRLFVLRGNTASGAVEACTPIDSNGGLRCILMSEKNHQEQILKREARPVTNAY